MKAQNVARMSKADAGDAQNNRSCTRIANLQHVHTGTPARSSLFQSSSLYQHVSLVGFMRLFMFGHPDPKNLWISFRAHIRRSVVARDQKRNSLQFDAKLYLIYTCTVYRAGATS